MVKKDIIIAYVTTHVTYNKYDSFVNNNNNNNYILLKDF